MSLPNGDRVPLSAIAHIERVEGVVSIAHCWGGLPGDAETPGANTNLLIAADKDVKYEAVLKVMDELQRADVRRVGLLVKPAAR